MKRFALFALMAIAVVAFTGCATTYQETYYPGPGYYPYYEPWPDTVYWWHGHDYDRDFHHGRARAYDRDFGHDRGVAHEGHEHMGHGYGEGHEGHEHR